MYVASPNGPLPRMFKLWLWGQNGPTLGSHVLHRLIFGNMRISSSETLIRPK